MVMNKLWKTSKHPRTLIKMAFLCPVRFHDGRIARYYRETTGKKWNLFTQELGYNRIF